MQKHSLKCLCFHNMTDDVTIHVCIYCNTMHGKSSELGYSTWRDVMPFCRNRNL